MRHDHETRGRSFKDQFELFFEETDAKEQLDGNKDELDGGEGNMEVCVRPI